MKSNKIYKGLIVECEKLEAEGKYKGNGHHLAQRLTTTVLVELLPKKQRHIYDQLDESYVTAKELADKAKIHTKEVSPNIKQINSKGTLVITKRFGYITKYKRA
jgi:DNA-binding MarR family transcriptional regulator